MSVLYQVGHGSFSFVEGYPWLCYQGTYRANSYTSQTGITPCISQWCAGQCSDQSINASEGEIEDAGALLVTYPNASAAQNTFVGVVDEQGVT